MLQKILGNPHLLKSRNDKMAFLFFFFGTHFAVWYESWVILPYYHGFYEEITPIIIWHVSVCVFVYIGWITNLFYMISIVTTVPYEQLRLHQQPDWKYCVVCEGYFPPRSHHCNVCNICVIKRDHHCWFGGGCVGFKNHRYYMIAVIYMWFAATYANIYNLQFVTEQLYGYGLGTFLCVMLPHAAAITGSVSFYQFFIAAVSFVAFMLQLLFSWLLYIQVAQIYHGQTMYERKHKVTCYDLGWRENVKEVLGERWYLTWISPWIPSRIKADGINFQKNAKDK